MKFRIAITTIGTTVGLLSAACSDRSVSTEPVVRTLSNGTLHSDAGTTGGALSGTTAIALAAAPGLCLDATNVDTANGTPLTTAACSGAASQQFTFDPSGAIRVSSGKCLDADMGRGQNGDHVNVWACNGAPQQRWTPTAAGTIVGVGGKCVDLAYGQQTPGGRMQIWTCLGNANQTWAGNGGSTVTAAAGGGSAELPRVYLNTAMPVATGRTIAVPAGGDLQAALNAAQPGDQVVLAPGASYVGNFVLPVKPGIGAGQWITVRSAGVLPAEGTRVGPGDAAQLPKLLTPNAAPAIATAPGTQGWRLTGLEISLAPGLTWTYDIVKFGTVGADQATLAQVPSRLVLDRAYVHGSPALDVRRCVALNSASTAVIDSYLADCHSRNGDSQAINGWNGPGPFKIVDNHLEGAHENIGFGGGDPSVPGLIPADIEIRRNHVVKPLTWKGTWTAKNLLELKAAQRVLVEANVFENNWVDGQNGFAFVWWSVNQDGGAPFIQTQDITFRYNRVVNVAGGFNLTDKFYATASQPMRRVTIANNVVTGLDGSNGRLYQLNGAVAGVTIVNNSGLGVAHDLVFATPDQPVPSLVFQNNVTGSQYTLFAAGYMGNAGLAHMGIPAANVTGNVFASGSGAGAVPAGNTYAPSVAALGFANLAGGDLTLTSSSPFTVSGMGGTQPGANVAAVNQSTIGVAQ